MENPNHDGAAFPPLTDHEPTAHQSEPGASWQSFDSTHRQLIQSMVANLSESEKVNLILTAAIRYAVVRGDLITALARDESRTICVHILACDATTPVKLFRVLNEFEDMDNAHFQWWFEPDCVIAMISFVDPRSATRVLQTSAEDVDELQLQWHAYTANCAACPLTCGNTNYVDPSNISRAPDGYYTSTGNTASVTFPEGSSSTTLPKFLELNMWISGSVEVRPLPLSGQNSYPLDQYDRIWEADKDFSPYHVSSSFVTQTNFRSSNIKGSPPNAVLQTARVLARRNNLVYYMPLSNNNNQRDYHTLLK
ncbi:leucine-rich repeat protein kinase family protein [Striga asiatica]|uniref:Leucine-rich repeat protein kinase family protein n=1 Tax=Striga asiatica TaxID=4170 RepID=A0A5A7PGS8_STRAF|nr:leucine-rich repeat protein kinase family protein [Striga asiatica]